ncbi:YcaO-like family protein [Thermodesulfobacteriota bacterium]
MRLQSGVALKSTLKKHTVGIDKSVAPSLTIGHVKQRLEEIDLDLVREIVRVDQGRLDIPVYVCRVGSDCNIPSPRTMGKGPSPEQSEASALMEMVERFSHANFPRPETHMRGTYGHMEGRTIPFADFFRIPDSKAVSPEENLEEFASLPFAWVPAYSLVRQADFLVPYEWFADIQGTNGLSAGNTLEETILQGLCEVLERHVCAVVNTTRRRVPTIDPATVKDPVARDLVQKLHRNRIRFMCKDFTLDTGIPTVACIALDPASFPKSEIVYCAGTATHPEKALIRALTEVQQMAVDTFTQDYYAGGLLPKLTYWQEAEFLFDGDEPVPIDSLPDVSSDDLLEEIQNCTNALTGGGFEPLVINITHPALGIPAVFVLMAGSQLYDMSLSGLNSTYFLGRRLRFIGRLEDATERFRLAMEQQPDSNLHCSMEIAACLRQMGQWEQAVEVYREAYFCKPDRLQQSQILHWLAVCTERLKEAASQE